MKSGSSLPWLLTVLLATSFLASSRRSSSYLSSCSSSSEPYKGTVSLGTVLGVDNLNLGDPRSRVIKELEQPIREEKLGSFIHITFGSRREWPSGSGTGATEYTSATVDLDPVNQRVVEIGGLYLTNQEGRLVTRYHIGPDRIEELLGKPDWVVHPVTRPEEGEHRYYTSWKLIVDVNVFSHLVSGFGLKEKFPQPPAAHDVNVEK